MSRPLFELKALATGLDHPEGVAFAPDGKLYATGEAGQVYRIDLELGQSSQFATTGGFGLGLTADAIGRLYVCDMGMKAVVRVQSDGQTEIFSTGPVDLPFAVPNFPAFGPDGSLYVSDSGGWADANGRIVRIAADGSAATWSRAASGFANGLALSPDGEYLYAVESNPPLISRIPITPDGSAGEREIVVTLPNCVPDGLAFDHEGGLLIACYAPDQILHLDARGRLETLYTDSCRRTLNAPTNLAFAGPDLEFLTIANLGGYTIQSARIGLKGAPVFWPEIAR